MAGGVTFTRQTGPINDSSKSRHYQGSGIVRYGGAWRGSFFPWFPARKKKSQLRHLIPGPCSSLLACPSLHHSHSYPLVKQQHQVRYPRRLTFAFRCTLCTLCSLSHLTHTATATSMQHLPVAPWHRGPRQILWRLFLCHLLTVPVYFGGFLLLLTSSTGFKTRHATRFKQLIRTPHHSSRAKAPTAPPFLRLPSPLHDPEVGTVWSARSHHTLLLKSLAQLTSRY